MKKSDFLRAFEAEVVFVEPGAVTPETKLKDLEGWDSMATIAYIALTDEKLGTSLPIESLDSCNTVGDLLGLVEGHLEE